MANRNIEAIEHKGVIYVSLEDMQAYLASLVDKAGRITGKEVLHHVLYQLAALRDKHPVR